MRNPFKFARSSLIAFAFGLMSAFPLFSEGKPSPLQESLGLVLSAAGAEAEGQYFIPLGESADYFQPAFGASASVFSFSGRAVGIRSSICGDWIRMPDQGTGGIDLFSLGGRVSLPVRILPWLSLEPAFRSGWYYGASEELGASEYGAMISGDLTITVAVFSRLSAQARIGYAEYLGLARGLDIGLGLIWRSANESVR
jgi:hypothetical protein